jgi:CDP-glycerol glycerophosphotransferase
LNTWHGIPFKCVGNDAGGRKDYNFDTLDYFCYSGEYEAEIYTRAFNVRKDVMIPSGLPRNDELYYVTEDEKLNLKMKLGLPLNKKVIMYAPTWRDSVDNGKSCLLCPPVDVAKWEKELGEQYVILFRMHAYTNKLMGLEFNEVIRDFSSYPSINDLFKVADLLISDYSAAIFDYAILERPIVSFAYDYEEYKELRGLYIDMEKEMPNGIFRTQDEVIYHIKTMDYAEECSKTKKMIKDKYLEYGGDATKKCVESLFNY